MFIGLHVDSNQISTVNYIQFVIILKDQFPIVILRCNMAKWIRFWSTNVLGLVSDMFP